MADKSKIDWGKIKRVAKRRLGIEEFRPGQRDLMQAALDGKDCLGIMPTGAGKSLCFQLPSLFLPSLTLVVSPLIALMQDQTQSLDEVGISAARLDSTLTAAEEYEAHESIEDGESRLAYCTPERLENLEFLETLKSAGVSLVVVDEAHCVSQWGHDFRPAFLNIRNAIQALGAPPVMALTATATPEIEDDIITQLGLSEPLIVRGGIERPNLRFRVKRTVNEGAKRAALLEILSGTKNSAIVYTATVKAAEEVRHWLRERSVEAEAYHGRLKASERERIQDEFMNGKTPVIVATKASGLGIDKPDVRTVIHYQFPDSVESYYQEAGRAGRDGEAAEAILLYQLEDKRIQSYFLGGKYPSRADAWAVYDTIGGAGKSGVTLKMLTDALSIAANKIKVLVAYLETAGVITRKRRLVRVQEFSSPEEMDTFLSAFEARYTSDRDRLQEMMRYGQTLECRMRFLRRYFAADEGELCKRCDNCLERDDTLDAA